MATHEYLRVGTDDTRARLRHDITTLMLKGAGYAMAFSLSVVFFVLIFYWIGLLLPEDSKLQPDPTPLSYDMTAPADRMINA